MKRIAVILLTAVLLLTCTAGLFGGNSEPEATPVTESKPFYTPEPAATPEPEPASTPEPEAATESAQASALTINPLTGEASDTVTASTRPVAVMLNNISVAQPQVGISQADMIWELMDEGGITRCMGFFTDIASVETMGSIRSARIYNVSMAQAFDAIFVHAGGSDEAMNHIASDGINNINALVNEGTAAFFRDPNRQSHGVEHSLFGRGAEILQLAQNMGYSLERAEGVDGTYGMTFSESAADQCTMDAAQIHITYAGGKTTNFTYDPEKDMYTAEQFGSVYADNGEEVVYFKNVLILNADTRLQSDGLHLTIALEGDGSGYFCCGGKYIPIKWTRSGSADSFHYFTEDGTPISLGVGKTFVAVQQIGGYTGTTEFIA